MTNNEAEYVTLILGLDLAEALGTESVIMQGAWMERAKLRKSEWRST